jgi:hypothetical protein
MIHQTPYSARELRFAAGLTIPELSGRTRISETDLALAERGWRLTSEQWVTIQHICNPRIEKFRMSARG